MTIGLSVAARNGLLDAIFTALGASPKLNFYSGSMPANAATARSGTLLASLALPSTPMAAASGGTKALTGTWSGSIGTGGTVGYFSLMDNAGTTCHLQGTVTLSGGGGDLFLDNLTVVAAQGITQNSFTLTAPNP